MGSDGYEISTESRLFVTRKQVAKFLAIISTQIAEKGLIVSCKRAQSIAMRNLLYVTEKKTYNCFAEKKYFIR